MLLLDYASDRALTFAGLPVQVNGKIYMIAQFEAPQPSAMYCAEMTQDASTGELSVADKLMHRNSSNHVPEVANI